MTRPRGTCWSALAVVTLAWGVSSAPGNADVGPYEAIVKRNPFDLKDMAVPPPPAPPPAPTAEKVDITLTGIQAISGPAKAYFVVKGKDNKPEYKTLSVGERDGGLEVMAIDFKGQTVKVRNAGKELVLNFTDNGAKAPASTPAAVNPPGGGRPGLPGAPNVGGQPTASAFNPGQPNSGPGGRFDPRSGGTPAAGFPGAVAPGGDANSSLRTIPVRNVRTGTDGAAAQPLETLRVNSDQPSLSPEAAIVIMEANRSANAAQIQNGNYPPLPPTPVSPDQ